MSERKQKVWRVRLITEHGNHTTIVRAKTARQAMGHVELKHVEISLATPEDVLAHGQAGGAIEDAVE